MMRRCTALISGGGETCAVAMGLRSELRYTGPHRNDIGSKSPGVSGYLALEFQSRQYARRLYLDYQHFSF